MVIYRQLQYKLSCFIDHSFVLSTYITYAHCTESHTCVINFHRASTAWWHRLSTEVCKVVNYQGYRPVCQRVNSDGDSCKLDWLCRRLKLVLTPMGSSHTSILWGRNKIAHIFICIFFRKFNAKFRILIMIALKYVSGDVIDNWFF